MPPRRRNRGLVSIRQVEAWHRGLDLVVHIYRLTREFPREELFGLTFQLRRAAISVPSNIAEGVERETAADRRKFLTQSKSSIAEIETQIEASLVLGYVTEQELLAVFEITDHLAAMLEKMRRNIGDHPNRAGRRRESGATHPRPHAHPPSRPSPNSSAK